MAERWFLEVDGIAGESTDDRHRGEIDVSAWSFGVTAGVPTDRVALAFGRIRISYRPRLADGSAGAAVTAGWDSPPTTL